MKKLLYFCLLFVWMIPSIVFSKDLELSSKEYLLYDLDKNMVLYEKDSDKSTTKKEILKINENIKNSLITATLNYLKIKHAVTYNELDLDNVIFLNGRLNLKTKEFLPHSPDVFNIFRLNVNYIEELDIETNSAVEEALSKLSEKDRKALLQFLGYSLTNRTDLNTFCCVIGKKSNEFKSILSDMLVKKLLTKII